MFLSLLGAELVQPRDVFFSDKSDIVSRLIANLVVSKDCSAAEDRLAENSAQALKKIVSSMEHVEINNRLIELHKKLFQQAFDDSPLVDCPKRFRYTVRVLSDWVLMTLGKFRVVDEKLFSECMR